VAHGRIQPSAARRLSDHDPPALLKVSDELVDSAIEHVAVQLPSRRSSRRAVVGCQEHIRIWIVRQPASHPDRRARLAESSLSNSCGGTGLLNRYP